MQIRRIMGKRGRITIPYPMRKNLDIKANDVVSFRMNDSKSYVIIVKEELYTNDDEDNDSDEDIIEFIDCLPMSLQKRILKMLFRKYSHNSKNENRNIRLII